MFAGILTDLNSSRNDLDRHFNHSRSVVDLVVSLIVEVLGVENERVVAEAENTSLLTYILLKLLVSHLYIQGLRENDLKRVLKEGFKDRQVEEEVRIYDVLDISAVDELSRHLHRQTITINSTVVLLSHAH